MKPYTVNLIAGVCIAIACAITVPDQPRSFILTVLLNALWLLRYKP